MQRVALCLHYQCALLSVVCPTTLDREGTMGLGALGRTEQPCLLDQGTGEEQKMAPSASLDRG